MPEVEAQYAAAEGLAMPGGPDGMSGPPTLVIRSDSLLRWDLGVAHELIHLLEASQGTTAARKVVKVWQSIRASNAQNDPSANPHEMFAYFGQWYMAGFGHIIQEHSPLLHQLCADLIGDAHVDTGGITEAQARATIASLFSWFSTGARPA